MTNASWVTNLWPYSLQVGLLVIAMGAMLAVLRVPSPRLRLVAWRVVLAVALLLPLQPWRVVRVVDASDANRATAADAANAAQRGRTTEDELAQAASNAKATSASTDAGWLDAIGATRAMRALRTVAVADWTFAIAATLIGGAICRLLWLAVGWHRLHRRLRQLTWPTRLNRVESPQPQAHGEKASQAIDAWETGLQQTFGTAARVEWIDDLSQPITFGVWPPVVLLPTRLAALPAEMQRAVICHELLHVRRRDWLWVLGEEIVRAAFWFHPAVWWLLDQLQAAREELVDRLTLRATGQRRAYLEALLAFAAEPEEPIAGAAAAFFRSRQLGRRIASLMREGTMTRTQRIATVIGLSLTLAAALAAAVITFPLQATAAAADSTVAASPAKPADTLAPRESAHARGTTFSTPTLQHVVTQRATRTRVEIRAAEDAAGPIERKARTLPEGAPAPKRIANVPFQFPPELANVTTTALLRLRVVLDDSGTVVESRVLSITFEPVSPASSGGALDKQMTSLGEYTRDVVGQWRYEPIENAPLALTVTVHYDARAKQGNASDDATPRVVYELRNEKAVHKRDLKQKKTVPDDNMAGGPGGGVSGGVSAGVSGGTTPGVPGGVDGGVVGGVPGGVSGGTAPGVPGGVDGGVVGGVPQASEEARQYPGHLRLAGSKAPRVIEEVRPRYPADAMLARLQGKVVLDLEVGADGLVTDTHVVDSVPGLDDAAIDAARQWRFEPTHVEGKAVPVVLTLSMVFTMR